MLYIKIGRKKYPIEKFSTFITQFGKSAVRVIGDAPLAANGFSIIDENNIVIGDMSEYKYFYHEDDTSKSYTKEYEEPVPTEGFAMGDIPTSPIQRQINAINQRVNAITPYTESKTAYIDDTEVRFNIAKEGIISVYMVDSEGKNVPHTFEQYNGQIIVSFETRTSLATVTISIQ